MDHGEAFSFQRAESLNHSFFIGGGIGLKFLASGDNLQVRNKADTAYAEIKSSHFNTVSSEKYKSDIRKYEGSALNIINATPIFDYLKEGSSTREIGVIIERGAPIEIFSEDKEAVNGYSMTGILWSGVKELSTEVVSNTDEINWLKQENQLLRQRISNLEGVA